MSKNARSFRLSAKATEHLATVQELTGSTQAAIIEQALALYRGLYDRDRDFVVKLLENPQSRNEG